MRVGLFTDTYKPSINGIVFVVDITRRHLEAMGHEVYIFCPSERIGRSELYADDDHIICFPSFRGVFFDDNSLSFFFPARELRRIKELKLDVIHFFTPSQVGLMGVYAAQKTDAVLVAQHSTDLAEYVSHYPAVLPGLLLLGPTLPMTFRFKTQDIRELLRIYKPRRKLSAWNQEIVEDLVAMVYSRCDAVIALSRKSKAQLESWRRVYKYEVDLLPTGIDALPVGNKGMIKDFKTKFGIGTSDEVVLYVGRLGSEKNLDILIPMIEEVIDARPNARLVFVGDFEHRETLENIAAESRANTRITFTGALPRDELGVVYGAADVFVFPSLTDTQGLVLSEAAQSGLPIVMIDKELSEVVAENENGLFARDDSRDMARCVVEILSDSDKKAQFSAASKKIAQRFGEYQQTKKIESLYRQALAQSAHRISTE